MDWSKVVHEAIAIAGSRSKITFNELDSLMSKKSVSSRDVEDLLDALRQNGIHVVES